MHLSRSSTWKRAVSAIVLAGVTAACAPDAVGPENATPLLGVADGDGAKAVYLCNWGEPGGTNTFRVTTSNDGGTLPRGSVFTLAVDEMEHGDCPVVWQSSWPRDGGMYDTQVTIEEIDIPAGVFIYRIIGQTYTDYVQYDNVQGVPPYVTSVSVTVNPDNPGRVWFKHIGVETPPPPPPPFCDGLTPGYWKNWRNHYTRAQFTTLLSGTIATSISQADAILSISDSPKSSAIEKLRKFVLANQLTLNLGANPGFPNPDGAGLSGTCTATSGGTQLGNALATAYQMLANPSAYTTEQILAVKDVLDAIANLGAD